MSPFDAAIAWAWAGPPSGSGAEAKARLLLLDTLGCAVAGLAHPRPRALAAALASWMPGPVQLAGAALSRAGAAAVLAASACWDEANEGLARAHGRPGLPVAPLALAALADGATLGEAVAAYALGYEVAGRAGELWRIRPGMHVDGSWHALGAATAAARLAGGDAATCARAVRLASCQVPFALYAPIAAGMDGRNSYPAHAALLGALAGAAAVARMDAPAGWFDEARRIALGLEGGAAEPPDTWLLEEAYLKPYAGVRHAHYAAAAAQALRVRTGPRRVARVRLSTYGEALRYAGNRAPRAAITAQFSLSWAVAATLTQGDLGPAAYTDAALGDPALRALEASVELVEDGSHPGRFATLTVTLDDGTVEEETVTSAVGDPDRPMTAEQAEAKFRRFAAGLGEARAAAIAELLLRAEPTTRGALDLT
ncbi:MmgE/PrpD family protein [Elioraea sp.]|uniref:MmgE/PrpD family protein n=1 Tax=Elioraea sp. TaxID=2185103 RepID=UPI003F72FF98